MRITIIFGLLMMMALSGYAQIPQVNFSVADHACLNSVLQTQNSSNNATNFEWDFCQGDLLLAPTATSVRSLAGNVTTGIDVVFDGSNWFGFVTNQNANSILRLNFGSDLNSIPSITDLGNISGNINRPTDIKVISESGNWFAFVYTLQGGTISRINFGNSLSNTLSTPASIDAEVVLSGAGAINGGFDLVFDGTQWIMLMTNQSTFTVVRFSSADAYPAPADIISDISSPFGDNLGDVSILNHSGNYFAYAVAYGNRKLQRLSFGSHLFTTPAVDDLSSSLPSAFIPYGIDIAFDNNTWLAYVSTIEGSLIRINLGADPAHPPVETTSLGSFSVLANTLKIRLIKKRSEWWAFAVDWSSTNLYRINFPAPPCKMVPSFSSEVEPIITATAPGTIAFSLRGYNASAVYNEQSGVIEVGNTQAPLIQIGANSICTNVETQFHVTSTANIGAYEWRFHDMSNSSDAMPVKIYPVPDLYDVSVLVTGENGCETYAKNPWKIYSPPVAAFDLPDGILCTNNEITLENSTPDNFEGNLRYEWQIDNQTVGDSRDLQINFTTTETKNVVLTAAIAGCSSTSSAVIENLLAGPIVDFVSVGHCRDTPVKFESLINDVYESLEWRFDDGASSDVIAPTHNYTDAGSFNVSLAATSPNGCKNKKVKTLTIDDYPQPEFIIEGPPSSCSASVSRFLDMTPSIAGVHLESWQWHFSDGGSSSEQNPTHIFQHSGAYDVELSISTETGCTSLITKSVSILQSPSLTFENTTPCILKPVNFSALSNADQYYWEIGAAYYQTQKISHTFTTFGSHAVKVSVIAPNGCVTTLTRDVVVPAPINPAFKYFDNCSNFETHFTPLISSVDPVQTYSWNFANEGISSQANPVFKFTSPGNKSVSLQVTTVSGCIYQRSQVMTIVEHPNVNFSFTPGFGVPPQEITFLNSSTNATSFRWDFNDGGSSEEQSPKHTFTDLGNYDVKLTASNTAGCETSTSKVISMVAPLPDVDLSLMTISPNSDGTSKVIITIANNGNTFLKNLPVRLDVSGNVTLETIVPELIPPFSKYNLVLNFGIAQNQMLEFLCASTTLEGDLNPEGNRICNQLKSDVAILSPYPNPAQNELTVEWVAQEGEQVQVDLVGIDGKSSISFIEISSAGLNQKTLDVSRLRSGIYILRIISPTRSKTHRIFVSSQN